MEEVTFKDWTDRLKVYNDYVKALGEYKVNTAKAEMQRAQAAGEWATVRLKETVIDQLARDLEALRRNRSSVEKEIAILEARQTNALLFLRGEPFQPTLFSHAWRSYASFEKEALLQAGGSLHDIKVPDSARTQDNFVSVRNDSALQAAPPAIDNALKLMTWLNEHQYVPKRGYEAQQVIIALFKAINSVAAGHVKELKDRLESMKNGTYNAWNFNAILGLPKNTPAASIEKAGAST